MRLPWSHCRNIIITGQGLRTRVEVPLYDIVGELMNVRREGGNLIINFVKQNNFYIFYCVIAFKFMSINL